MGRKQRIGDTPVTHGWVVKKAWKTEGKDPRDRAKTILIQHDKVISKRFYSPGAANSFREVAEKTYRDMPAEITKDGETDVQFYVTEDTGYDDIRAPQ
jgi:hypothetical protein